MSEPVNIEIDPDVWRRLIQEQEDDWREGRKLLAEMGWDLDEDEEERKSQERLANLDAAVERMKQP